MLITMEHLEGIKSGKITCAFRKWSRPSVKTGSLIQTAIGRVEILNVRPVDPVEIIARDARQAGFENLSTLRQFLNHRAEGKIYRIDLRYHSPDPRIALRQKTELSPIEFKLLTTTLQRMDSRSAEGPWTIQVLKAIHAHPHLSAVDLAAKLNTEKEWLKSNIRKLKNLGLTVSHEVGYSLSPLGLYYLNHFGK